MEAISILVVDDEPDITELIGLYLTREGYDVHITDNGTDAVRLTGELRPDLIVLDIQLKQLDGLEVCRQIRETSDVPILFVSCKDDDNDIIHGLDVGGDDYMTKPFSPRQLVARVQAQLRRQTIRAERQAEAQTVLTFEELTIDLQARTVVCGSGPAALSVKEFDLLAYLARNPNKVFRLDDLYQVVWGADSVGDTRTLMVHISNLRKKIELDPAHPHYIHTVRGIGYKFNPKEGYTHVHR
ncbi:transcriptional regulator [Paenibacillus darwinianus]|uniref:Transcriptional regulator n=1 Tax=Paenibacillus darwinianus TaxID=1380763 RepID=A0A9W5RZ47_9BACL|nr:response regulator transcription factor [Paenibacillus darwinianus]EXX86496.1 transcriptional regulator [Paenibacillus darwinianus]EXX86500.1 transcriptional regulator [Paenibacillus darwinianus]EXX87576.1 transcriptional regulator [Paenibacillus darwinianus]